MPNIGPTSASRSISAMARPPLMRPEGRLLTRFGFAHAYFSRSAAARRIVDKLARAYARSDAEPGSMRVDTRQDTILISRAGVADAGARRGDRGGEDAAGVERRQPGDAGLVDADPGIVEERGERIVFERGLRPAAQQPAMRPGDDNRSDMLGADCRGRVERPHRRRLGISRNADFQRRRWRRA